jgi:hypothetical protein
MRDWKGEDLDKKASREKLVGAEERKLYSDCIVWEKNLCIMKREKETHFLDLIRLWTCVWCWYFERERPIIDSCIESFCSLFMTLFWDVVEPLGHRALLEVECHWGLWAEFWLALFAWAWVWGVRCVLLAYWTCWLVEYLFGTKSKPYSFFFEVLFVIVVYYNNKT